MTLRVPSDIFESLTICAATAVGGVTCAGAAGIGASVGGIVGGIVGEWTSTAGAGPAGSTGGVLVSWPHAMDAVVMMNKRTPIHLNGKSLP
jgi:hypothetical protein